MSVRCHCGAGANVYSKEIFISICNYTVTIVGYSALIIRPFRHPMSIPEQTAALNARQGRLVLLWPRLALPLIAALWTFTLIKGRSETHSAELAALKDASAYAGAYEQYVTRSVAQMDQVTMQLKQSWEQSGAALNLEDLHRDGMFTDSAFISVTIAGRDGRILSSTRRRAAPANIGRADYFLYHRDNNSTALRINVPGEQL